MPSIWRGHVGERLPALGELRVGGEHPGALDVAAGGACRLVGRSVVDTLGAQAVRRCRATSIARKSMRAQRDEIVIRSCGTKSARITNVVDGGGSSIVFSRIAGTFGTEQMELVEDHHLVVALDGASDDL